MHIFVPSYPSIFFALFHLIKSDSVIIITNNRSIKKFLDHIQVEYIYYESEFSFKHIIRHKKVLDTILNNNNFKHSNFYLLDNAFAIDGFYLASKWNKGKVYYSNLSTEFKPSVRNANFSNRIKKRIIENIFGIDLIYRQRGNQLIFGIGDNFFNSNEILPVENKSIPYNYKDIAIKHHQVKLKTSDYLFIDQGQMKGIIIYSSLTNILAKLINSKPISVKEHPKHNSSLEFSFNYKYPDHIPAEFILQNIKYCIISVYSLTLLAASKFEHLKVISLLELVDWYNEEYKNETKKFLIKESNNKILFPKTESELFELL